MEHKKQVDGFATFAHIIIAIAVAASVAMSVVGYMMMAESHDHNSAYFGMLLTIIGLVAACIIASRLYRANRAHRAKRRRQAIWRGHVRHLNQ